jgi:hypothetical protein
MILKSINRMSTLIKLISHSYYLILITKYIAIESGGKVFAFIPTLSDGDFPPTKLNTLDSVITPRKAFI